jgi:hypothetical protein
MPGDPVAPASQTNGEVVAASAEVDSAPALAFDCTVVIAQIEMMIAMMARIVESKLRQEFPVAPELLFSIMCLPRHKTKHFELG